MEFTDIAEQRKDYSQQVQSIGNSGVQLFGPQEKFLGDRHIILLYICQK